MVLVAAVAYAITSLRPLILRYLAERIRPPAGVPLLKDGLFIAVLPASVPDDGLKPLAEKLAADVSLKLMAFRGLSVASSRGVANVGTRGSHEDIARQLDVNLLVSGKAEKEGGQVAFKLTLENIVERRRIWTKSFICERQDSAATAENIYPQIVAALGVVQKPADSLSPMTAFVGNANSIRLCAIGKQALLRHENEKTSIQSALDSFKAASVADSNYGPAWVDVAWAYWDLWRLKKKDDAPLKEAQKAAEKAVSLAGNFTQDEYMHLGYVFDDSGAHEKALREFRLALDSDPDSNEVWRLMGKANLAEENRAEGIFDYVTAKNIKPTDAFYWDQLGQAYYRVARYDEAVRAYDEAIKLKPEAVSEYETSGLAYLKIGDYPDAEKDFRRFKTLAPESADGYENLASALLGQGRYDECRAEYQKALDVLKAESKEPGPEIYYNLGNADVYQGRNEEAIEYFKQALTLDPTDYQAKGSLADTYKVIGKNAEAIQAYHDAINLAHARLDKDPTDWVAKGELATYLAVVGDGGVALTEIETARANDPENVELMYAEAQVQAALGNSTEAITCLERAFRHGYRLERANLDPELKDLRDLGAYKQMIARITEKSN